MSWPLPPILLRAKTLRWPALWVPVVVLWPLYLVVFVVGLLFSLPLAAALRAPVRAVLLALLETFRLLCALHGSQLVLSRSAADRPSDARRSWTLTIY